MKQTNSAPISDLLVKIGTKTRKYENKSINKAGASLETAKEMAKDAGLKVKDFSKEHGIDEKVSELYDQAATLGKNTYSRFEDVFAAQDTTDTSDTTERETVNTAEFFQRRSDEFEKLEVFVADATEKLRTGATDATDKLKEKLPEVKDKLRDTAEKVVKKTNEGAEKLKTKLEEIREEESAVDNDEESETASKYVFVEGKKHLIIHGKGKPLFAVEVDVTTENGSESESAPSGVNTPDENTPLGKFEKIFQDITNGDDAENVDRALNANDDLQKMLNTMKRFIENESDKDTNL